ncbi:MAG TPA: phytanoyl-CoA dioxygenase family protein [Planctomycetota bacterium]|nr:phytanoyl-CoA dioxygenase family protein [Planctomycetota bacterium]
MPAIAAPSLEVTTTTPAETLLDTWKTQGCIIVRGLFERARTERLRVLCEDILSQWRYCDAQSGRSADPDRHEMRHINHPSYFRHQRERLADILNMAADPNVLRIASAIFTEPPLFRCTSLYFNPLKTSEDGNWHRDSQFMTRTDEDEQKMLADGGSLGLGLQLQVALVPSDDVEYVPGSHLRWDTPEEYAIRKADNCRNWRSNNMPGAVKAALQPGDAVLFNPMGFHRGRYHVDKLRRTVMLTYTRRSSPCFDYFPDQPWFDNPGYLDGVTPAAREFYSEFIRVYQDHWQIPWAVRAATKK